MGKTALVLGGGGARGSYELGVWQALREMDVTIHLVTGTSIGAINGSLVAQGSYDTAVALWDRLETSHVFDVPLDEQKPVKSKVLKTYQTFVRNFVKSGGTDSNPLRETLHSFFDEEKIRSSPIDYGLVTLEMDSRKPHELWKNEIPQGRIIDYILASASIYPAIKPYLIDGVRYIDGAYHDNMPVRMALERGATDIVAVDLEAFGVVKKEELKLAHSARYIRSYWDLGPTLVFDHATMKHNARLGYLDALKSYGMYDGAAYTFIKGFTASLSSHFLEQDYTGRLFGGGEQPTMLDKMLWGRVSKFLEERGLSDPTHRDLSLVCAEVAGEIFGLDPEKIYSEEIWLARLRPQVMLTELPEGLTGGDSETRHGILESLRKTASLLNLRVRTKFAAAAIRYSLDSGNEQKLIANAAFMPDAFLGGAYLALMGLV